ncbi:FAD-binding and (Fe-S)-binding domain-containing protein [Kocuria sp.]|uniref:FAD-binding and (Fe-S)-binding domain-containing protein n=1 Tax=Kocuria sp. TaxID=1871328 RepID=UPI0026E014D7|nr:FAD-binding and (Fe-S)-binding domain-containing protein [Kocuria sp.]MDO5618135.1 FAD-binding and (Fe-S)-binding domain-containing protein [Kocuria sp.]
MTVPTRPRRPGAARQDPLLEQLRAWPGDTVTSELQRLTTAHDASHYLLYPRALVRPHTAAQVGSLLRILERHGAGLTLRSGGTSLSGQAVTDQVLVDVRRHFRGFEILDDGARIRIRPGSTVREANTALAPYGRKLGPDPASESACTVGGVIANNSSGMHCGTEFNTYQTLESMVLVTPSGTVVDTAVPDADQLLREAEPELHEGLLRLRQRVRENADSVATIQRLFAMKNTMGYGLNAFLDQAVPVKILERLMIGAEGTLGFVAEAVFRTVPIHPHVATGLLVFPDLYAAAEAVPQLVATHSGTVELMDATSLKVAQASGQAPRAITGIAVDQHTALLVEYQGDDTEELAQRTHGAHHLFAQLPLVARPELTQDPAARAGLWTVRKGLYAAVAGHRPSGTNALLEDVVVPVQRLGSTCEALTEMFSAHDYRDSVIFGHAKDGNVHFLLNEDFSDPTCLARYERFTEDMVDLILGHGGSLKAEHGTGRIMAPYVERQYGTELYAVMRELKTLVDPGGLFNPGVILNSDPRCYLQDLKIAPTLTDPAEAEADRCVECGYCEPVCPSKDLTLTPRQRIVGRREITAAHNRGDHDDAAALLTEYSYQGEQTCAVDGMCSTACPVFIDTGDLVRKLRTENTGWSEGKVWDAAAKNWGSAVTAASTALSVAKAVPPVLPRTATSLGRKILGADRVPEYVAGLPRGGESRPSGVKAENPVAVFFPACVSTMFGASPARRGTDQADRGEREEGAASSLSSAQAFLALCERADVEITVPDNVSGACCGTPWKSKGKTAGYTRMQEITLPLLWEATDRGRLPVVCDASSCTEGLEVMKAHAAASEFSDLRFVDAVEFVANQVLPELTVRRRKGSMALHPTCSSTQLGLNGALNVLAQAVAEEVVTPVAWNCCGYAGDRGMLHPELTASATAREAAEITQRDFDAYASLNRTCELGMTQATGKPYRHILQHLENATSPTSP